jgi:hypothetical protein
MKFAKAIDLLFVPVVALAALPMKVFRRLSEQLPLSQKTLAALGVFPIRDHYYEPLFQAKHLNADFDKPRSLSGIDWNECCQLELLDKLGMFGNTYSLEINRNFGHGDADSWNAMIRFFKPKRIIEVGSGFSTRIALQAAPDAEIICIEPYEMPWLESTRAEIIRKRVEDVPRSFFEQLEASDILFIDSSHIIRPQGDVLVEILEIFPLLRPGVVVHFHDILSPFHYPRKWVVDYVRLWNEQYLLEAFLSFNRDWEILCALNYLSKFHWDAVARAFPNAIAEHSPGSFYIRRRKHS